MINQSPGLLNGNFFAKGGKVTENCNSKIPYKTIFFNWSGTSWKIYISMIGDEVLFFLSVPPVRPENRCLQSGKSKNKCLDNL